MAKTKAANTEPKGEPMTNAQLTTNEDLHGKESVHTEA